MTHANAKGATAMPCQGGARERQPDIATMLALVAALSAALLLKLFYASASATDLRFILAPSAGLAQVLSGYVFIAEQGAGYVSREAGLVITPACAGVNFLVVTWLSLCVLLMPRLRGARGKVLGCLAIATLSYLATILANALRIALAIPLRRYFADDPASWVSPSMAHRIEGTFVYLAALLLLCHGVSRIWQARAPQEAR